MRALASSLLIGLAAAADASRSSSSSFSTQQVSQVPGVSQVPQQEVVDWVCRTGTQQYRRITPERPERPQTPNSNHKGKGQPNGHPRHRRKKRKASPSGEGSSSLASSKRLRPNDFMFEYYTVNGQYYVLPPATPHPTLNGGEEVTTFVRNFLRTVPEDASACSDSGARDRSVFCFLQS